MKAAPWSKPWGSFAEKKLALQTEAWATGQPQQSWTPEEAWVPVQEEWATGQQEQSWAPEEPWVLMQEEWATGQPGQSWAPEEPWVPMQEEWATKQPEQSGAPEETGARTAPEATLALQQATGEGDLGESTASHSEGFTKCSLEGAKKVHVLPTYGEPDLEYWYDWRKYDTRQRVSIRKGNHPTRVRIKKTPILPQGHPLLLARQKQSREKRAADRRKCGM